MGKRTWLVLAFLALVVLAGCGKFSGGESVTPIVEPGYVIFEDDFAEDEIGAPPSKWTTNSDLIAQYGFIEVVADDDVPSGRAVHFRANKHAGGHKLNMTSPQFGQIAEGAKKIGIEYWLKYVEGSAVYHYIPSDKGNRLMFLPAGNHLKNREKGASGNVSKDVTELEEGWNQIRVIMDRDTSKLVFYVNDMDNPIVGNFEALNPIETVADLRIQFIHETSASEFREAYYSGFKVWVVE